MILTAKDRFPIMITSQQGEIQDKVNPLLTVNYIKTGIDICKI